MWNLVEFPGFMVKSVPSTNSYIFFDVLHDIVTNNQVNVKIYGFCNRFTLIFTKTIIFHRTIFFKLGFPPSKAEQPL